MGDTWSTVVIIMYLSSELEDQNIAILSIRSRMSFLNACALCLRFSNHAKFGGFLPSFSLPASLLFFFSIPSFSYLSQPRQIYIRPFPNSSWGKQGRKAWKSDQIKIPTPQQTAVQLPRGHRRDAFFCFLYPPPLFPTGSAPALRPSNNL